MPRPHRIGGRPGWRQPVAHHLVVANLET
jgi:hypothetical protein